MNNKRIIILLVILCVLASCAGHSQSFNFKRSTVIELTAVAGSMAADGYSSPWKKSQEYNPVFRPFVSSASGRSAYFSASFGAVLLANKMLSRHPKMRHVMNWSIVGTELFWTASNIHNNNLYGSCTRAWERNSVVIAPCH